VAQDGETPRRKEEKKWYKLIIQIDSIKIRILFTQFMTLKNKRRNEEENV